MTTVYSEGRQLLRLLYIKEAFPRRSCFTKHLTGQRVLYFNEKSDSKEFNKKFNMCVPQ